MKIKDFIHNWRKKDEGEVLFLNNGGLINNLPYCRYNFADMIFYNICDLLTDIANDVSWQFKGSANTMDFAGFNTFYSTYGKYCLNTLFENGYIVIGKKDWQFFILDKSEYTTTSEDDATKVRAFDPTVEVYVMKSLTWRLRQMSDKTFCYSWLQYLNDVLNGSATISKRLGTFVIGSPSAPSNYPQMAVLNEKQKSELEKQIQKEYGTLSDQKQIMILPNGMNFQTINLAGLDQKTTEKARLAILAICDRIKVPANQVAIIDANSSKSLSNGSELREGDFNKYQSFERLLNSSFVEMAKYFNIQLDYTIYNKPMRQIL